MLLSKKPVSPTWRIPPSFAVNMKCAWASSWLPSTKLNHSPFGPFPTKFVHPPLISKILIPDVFTISPDEEVCSLSDDSSLTEVS